MRRYDRLSIVVSLVLLGMALPSIIELPDEPLSFTILDFPLTLNLSGTWLLVGILAALACTGTDSLVRSHPRVRSAGPSYAITFCGLPSLLTLAAFSLLSPFSPNRPLWLGGLALTGFALSLTIIGQYRTIERDDAHYGIIRMGLNLIAYIVALVLYITIFDIKVQGLLSAAGVLLVSGLLALDLLRVGDVKRTWIYALVAGLAMGEMAWALSYWEVSSLAGGMSLLLLFYIITGLSQRGLSGRLTRRVLIEFALVAILGFMLIYRYAP